MRLLLLTLVISFFLISCNKDEHETKSQHITTQQLKDQESTNIDESETTNTGYKLGVDYFEINPPYLTEDGSHVVVYEFFGYTCPHCFHFEPFLNKWLDQKPDHVILKRVALNFQPAWSIYQQAFLTAQTMGILDQTHSGLFKALHEEHKRFRTIEELAAWYQEQIGVDKEAFLSTAESFILDSAQRKADSMGFKMQITGTPSLVVNGKYKVSSKIRDRDEIFNVLKFLIEKETATMGLISK